MCSLNRFTLSSLWQSGFWVTWWEGDKCVPTLFSVLMAGVAHDTGLAEECDSNIGDSVIVSDYP